MDHVLKGSRYDSSIVWLSLSASSTTNKKRIKSKGNFHHFSTIFLNPKHMLIVPFYCCRLPQIPNYLFLSDESFPIPLNKALICFRIPYQWTLQGFIFLSIFMDSFLLFVSLFVLFPFPPTTTSTKKMSKTFQPKNPPERMNGTESFETRKVKGGEMRGSWKFTNEADIFVNISLQFVE